MLVGPPKDRHVRLIPMAALDGRDLKWIKVAETKGCHLMAMGAGSSADPCHYFCVAVKKTVCAVAFRNKVVNSSGYKVGLVASVVCGMATMQKFLSNKTEVRIV